MMYKKIFILICFSITINSFSQTGLSYKKRKAIDSFLNQWDNSNASGIAVAILKDGKVVYKKCLGSSNLEYNVPIKSNSVFQIASASKQFTAMGIAMLIEKGVIGLDDDIRMYLPELPEYTQKISIANLLTHTSGLKDQWDLLYLSGWKPDDVITNEDALNQIFKQKSLNFSTGTKYQYSNSGYTLLALILERVTKTPFQKWMKNNILIPLAMDNSFFIENQNVIIKNRVISYKSSEDGFDKLGYNSTTIGSNGLYTTLDDLCKWVKNYNEPILGNSSVHKMINGIPMLNNKSPELKLIYGFGQEMDEYRGEKFIWHDGSDAGYRTLIGRFPEHSIAIIILSNIESTDTYNTASKIANILLAEKFKKPVQIANQENQLFLSSVVEKAIDGNYIINDTLALRINVFDHNIMAENVLTKEQFYFKPTSKTSFENKKRGIMVSYLKDNINKVDTLLFKISNKDYKVTKALNTDIENLKEFVGTYYSKDLELSYDIIIKDQRLYVIQPRGFSIKIIQTSPDEFEGEYWWLRTLNIKRNDAKKVIGFTINNYRTKNIEFKKI